MQQLEYKVSPYWERLTDVQRIKQKIQDTNKAGKKEKKVEQCTYRVRENKTQLEAVKEDRKKAVAEFI
ncbi:hypothetical protein JCGZ_14823 [Jatropha curcas]|uniref:Uncharacterized protein n=1 Tax=Jatropha curcas TaxID=180498 RepID=A0A067K9A0_JATCU|nr:hypothetical protein JCGZ_14823 [Jatropha curcas]